MTTRPQIPADRAVSYQLFRLFKGVISHPEGVSLRHPQTCQEKASHREGSPVKNDAGMRPRSYTVTFRAQTILVCLDLTFSMQKIGNAEVASAIKWSDKICHFSYQSAFLAKSFLIDLGIEEHRIAIGGRSRNT